MTLRDFALTLSLLPAAEALADTSERDAALKLPDMLISANRQVEERSASSAANSVFTGCRRAQIAGASAAGFSPALQRRWRRNGIFRLTKYRRRHEQWKRS